MDAAEYNVATSGSRPRKVNEEGEKGPSGEVSRTKDGAGHRGRLLSRHPYGLDVLMVVRTTV
jgi:hypothetical protein